MFYLTLCNPPTTVVPNIDYPTTFNVIHNTKLCEVFVVSWMLVSLNYGIQTPLILNFKNIVDIKYIGWRYVPNDTKTFIENNKFHLYISSLTFHLVWYFDHLTLVYSQNQPCADERSSFIFKVPWLQNHIFVNILVFQILQCCHHEK